MNTNDEGDIDDGEFWGDAEENDVAFDLDELTDEQCDHVMTDNEARSCDNELANKGEEEQFRRAHSIVTFLSVTIAIWSYRHNVTQSALNALLRLLGLFFITVFYFFFPFVYICNISTISL